MDKREEMKPEWCPQDIWDNASDATWWVDDPESVRAAHECAAKMILQARSQAYEECAKIVDKRAKKAANVSAGACLAMMLALPDAIRQHSQKGGEK